MSLHGLSSRSSMEMNEIHEICEGLERKGVLSIGTKGRKPTYTLV